VRPPGAKRLGGSPDARRKASAWSGNQHSSLKQSIKKKTAIMQTFSFAYKSKIKFNKAYFQNTKK
jgi:hypothetical protein